MLKVKVKSCPTLCDPVDCSPSGSSVHGILQARILEWVAISFSNACMQAKSLQSCLTLCDPVDCSQPGSSVHGILQARILKRVAISSSRTSFSLFTFMHWRRTWQPTPVFLPGESQGQRSLVGCCLWGHTESDTTEVT